MTSPAITVLLVLALVAILHLITRRTRKQTPFSSLPLPPGPPTLPLIGNLHQAPKSHPWLQYHAWSKAHPAPDGSAPGILHLNMAGQSVIVLTTTKAAHDLLNKKGSSFSDRPHLVVAHELALNGYHMLLRPYDDRFRLHQKLEAPVLTERAAKAYQVFQDLEVRQLLWDILDLSSSSVKNEIDPHAPLERASASVIYSLFYGHRARSDQDPILQECHSVNHEFGQIAQVGRYLVDSFPVLNKLPAALAPWKAEAAGHWVRQCSLHVGNLRRGLAGKGWNVSKQMRGTLSGMEKGGLVEGHGGRMPEEELAMNVGIMADAAFDASTETLAWFLVAWVVEGQGNDGGKIGGWVKKAQAELDRVVGRERLPSFEDRGELGYINYVVEEVLRWRPAGAAGVPHFTKVESSYQGFRIPANSVVIANAWSIGREEGVFGQQYDVERFVPERFEGRTKAECEKTTAGFGYGRRVCPGRFVARNMLWITVARLLWAFDVSPALDERGEPVAVDTKGMDGLVTKPLPFNCRFQPRGDWVREIVKKDCDTWEVDHHAMLDEIALGVFP